MVHFPQSYEIGKREESKVLPIIRDFFNRDIFQILDKWSKFDFEDNETIYELKTRTNSKTKYSTTLMTCNKVTNEKRDLIFLFQFTDELCFIPYEKRLFDTFEKKPYSRINAEYDKKDYYFIPIEHLQSIKMCDYI